LVAAVRLLLVGGGARLAASDDGLADKMRPSLGLFENLGDVLAYDGDPKQIYGAEEEK